MMKLDTASSMKLEVTRLCWRDKDEVLHPMERKCDKKIFLDLTDAHAAGTIIGITFEARAEGNFYTYFEVSVEEYERVMDQAIRDASMSLIRFSASVEPGEATLRQGFTVLLARQSEFEQLASMECETSFHAERKAAVTGLFFYPVIP